jgi:hypothetical protein
MLTDEQRSMVEGVTILILTAATMIALWLLSGASHVPA